MQRHAIPAAILACALAAPLPLAAQAPQTARGDFVGPDGKTIGHVELTQAATGVLIAVQLSGLPEGTHGFHIHETGVCEPPFESAGGHFNPTDAPHGYFAEGGPHAGDLPNIHVGADGAATVEVFATRVTLADGDPASLLAGDGTAVMVHLHGDDYRTQPTGDAGERLACAVIAP